MGHLGLKLASVCILVLAQSTHAAVFGGCPKKCFLFFHIMSRTDPETNECQNICAIWSNGARDLGWECGLCPAVDAPTIAPSSASLAPTQAPVLPSEQFDIDLDLTNISSEFHSVFDMGRQRWEKVIVGDQVDIIDADLIEATRCENVPIIVDDLHICVFETAIDNTNGILAGAAAEIARVDRGTPVLGFVEVDEADAPILLANGELKALALGITDALWERKGISTGCGNYAVNTKASQEWQKISGCATQIPVELDGLVGTRCAHWDEFCLQDELLTGFLTTVINPLSTMTIGSLEDLGYEVDYDAADPYTASDINPSCLCDSNGSNGHHSDHSDVSDLAWTNGHWRQRHLSSSSSVRQTAMQYGLDQLELASYHTKGDLPDGAEYIGDLVFFVAYRETTGEIRGVAVRKGDSI